MIETAGDFGPMEPARRPGPALAAGRLNILDSMRFTFLFLVMLATTAAAPGQDSHCVLNQRQSWLDAVQPASGG